MLFVQWRSSKAPMVDVAKGEGWKVVVIPDNLPSELKDYEGFTLSFNSDNGTPNYVAWELLGTEADGSEPRGKKFARDEEVAGCPAPSDYSNSGYDRGHMCPAGDQKWSPQAMEDCFYMTNMCPQDNKLNARAWRTLEMKERDWAMRDSALWIVAGPIYEPSDKEFIGHDTRVRVPSAFFKVICAPYLDNPRAIGFIYPNMLSPGDMWNYSMSVDQVEEITGFDFFPELPDELENRIEAERRVTEWRMK